MPSHCRIGSSGPRIWPTKIFFHRFVKRNAKVGTASSFWCQRPEGPQTDLPNPFVSKTLARTESARCLNPLNPNCTREGYLQPPSMAAHSSGSTEMLEAASTRGSARQKFFVWREFLWGAVAGGFGEGLMHPIDTIKTRIQSQAIFTGTQNQKTVLQMVRIVWSADGLKGLYRGVTPGLTGSFATGATYFGCIESTKKWIDESHPNLGGHWSHFIAGAMGDTLGSFVYVPCEVMKQRMQVQGSRHSWSSIVMEDSSHDRPGGKKYYRGIFHAGRSIWMEQGFRGLYTGFWSTLARDVPFAGLMVMFYESLKDLTEFGKQKLALNSNYTINSSIEGLLLGGLAGGCSAYLTTPLDVVKTRLQVQGPSVRYKGWVDAIHRIWLIEGPKGMFRGSIPRITWYIPASALTFMAVEFLREQFNEEELDQHTKRGL